MKTEAWQKGALAVKRLRQTILGQPA